MACAFHVQAAIENGQPHPRACLTWSTRDSGLLLAGYGHRVRLSTWMTNSSLRQARVAGHDHNAQTLEHPGR
jgi:hypothetical protein